MIKDCQWINQKDETWEPTKGGNNGLISDMLYIHVYNKKKIIMVRKRWNGEQKKGWTK